MPRRRFPHPGWLLLSLAVTAAIAGPGTYFLKPHLVRWYYLRNLTSPDTVKREKALKFVIARARNDPAVLGDAVARLDVPDKKNFIQIVNAIDHAGRWRRTDVSDAAWFRWLDLLGGDSDAHARVVAAQRLGDLTDLANAQTVGTRLLRLAGDPDPDVRYNAVIAAAALAGADRGANRPLAIVAAAAGDANPGVASQAWIFLGLLRPAHLPPADWRRALPAGAAPAMLWAVTQGDHADPRIATEALNDPAADPDVRAMAVYALHLNQAPQSAEAITAWLTATREPLTAQTQAIYWRAILALPDEPAANTDAVLTSLSARWPRPASQPGATQPAGTQPAATHPIDLADPLRVVLAYRRGVRTQDQVPALLAGDPLIAAATFAGTPPGRWNIPTTREMPDLLRLLALGAMRQPTPEDLYPLLASDVPAIRDQACLFAQDHFTAAQNTRLIVDALKDFDDNAKMSGAILAGLTGLQGDLLARKADDETAFPAQQVMRLGLWMQGRLPGVAASVPGLLTRPDLPKTTVLLALMHMREPVAYDYLLNPRGEPLPHVLELLTYQHWWVVLHHYLPADAPDFWPWADQGLARFQLETIRDWCLIHPPEKWRQKNIDTHSLSLNPAPTAAPWDAPPL